MCGLSMFMRLIKDFSASVPQKLLFNVPLHLAVKPHDVEPPGCFMFHANPWSP